MVKVDHSVKDGEFDSLAISEKFSAVERECEAKIEGQWES